MLMMHVTAWVPALCQVMQQVEVTGNEGLFLGTRPALDLAFGSVGLIRALK